VPDAKCSKPGVLPSQTRGVNAFELQPVQVNSITIRARKYTSSWGYMIPKQFFFAGVALFARTPPGPQGASRRVGPSLQELVRARFFNPARDRVLARTGWSSTMWASRRNPSCSSDKLFTLTDERPGKPSCRTGALRNDPAVAALPMVIPAPSSTAGTPPSRPLRRGRVFASTTRRPTSNPRDVAEAKGRGGRVKNVKPEVVLISRAVGFRGHTRQVRWLQHRLGPSLERRFTGNL